MDLRDQKGAASTVFVVAIAAAIAVQIAVLYSYVAHRADYQGRMRQAYDLTTVLEELASYLRTGNELYRSYASQGAVCPTSYTVTNLGGAIFFCLPPTANTACVGVVHNGVEYCLNAGGNTFTLTDNVDTKSKRQNYANYEATPTRHRSWALEKFENIMTSSSSFLARVAVMESKLIPWGKLRNQVKGEAVAAVSGQNLSQADSVIDLIDSTASANSSLSIASVTIPSSPNTVITTEACTTSTCGVVALCPPWMNGTCTSQTQRLSLGFKLIQ